MGFVASFDSAPIAARVGRRPGINPFDLWLASLGLWCNSLAFAIMTFLVKYRIQPHVTD